MPTIIRATDKNLATSSVAFNFDDMAVQAKQYLDKIRVEAVKIVAQAQQEAAAVRQKAEQEGRQAAMAAVEQMVERKLGTVLPALRQAIQDIHQAKQSWLAAWETSAIHVAAAMAKRAIRRELTAQPDIPLTLVRESLELAAGSPQLRLHLNPVDYQAIGSQVELIVREMAGLGETQLISDPSITPGGCRVETRFGTIDQQFEAQLARIEEELRP
jgi:flagellar assembly protein FliH